MPGGGRVGASPRSLAAGACCLYISADRPTGYGMTDWIPYISKCFYMNILKHHHGSLCVPCTCQDTVVFLCTSFSSSHLDISQDTVQMSCARREQCRATESDETREARLRRTIEKASWF